MGPLATANQQIRDAQRQWAEQRIARLTRPHLLTDRLLDDLEELNLDGVRQVPERLGPALEELRRHLTGYAGITDRMLQRLAVGIRTTDLIETIFNIQEIIAPPTLDEGAFPFEDVTVM